MNKPKILLVDDDNDILDLFEIFLFNHFEIVTAQNGFDALTIAKKENPQCIVTDIMMPIMDGIQLIKRIRQVENLKDIPVIATSAFTSVLQESSLTNVGFSAVVPKPVNRKMLISTIQGILGDVK